MPIPLMLFLTILYSSVGVYGEVILMRTRKPQGLATPAVAAGLADYPRNLRWIGDLIDEHHGRLRRSR